MQQQPGQPNQSGGSSSSHTHLQAIPPHGYYGGTGHNNSYNKSSSYPNFASNLSESAKHHRGHPAHGPSQVALPQQVPVAPVPPQHQQPAHVPPHGNFMYHRHSLNNISAHQHQQQFLQQLQSQQQQQSQQLLPSIYLSTMGGGGQAVAKKEVPLKDSQQQQKSDDSGKSQSNNNNNNNSIGDINSRLEFLCLQMTEQAIN